MGKERHYWEGYFCLFCVPWLLCREEEGGNCSDGRHTWGKGLLLQRHKDKEHNKPLTYYTHCLKCLGSSTTKLKLHGEVLLEMILWTNTFTCLIAAYHSSTNFHVLRSWFLVFREKKLESAVLAGFSHRTPQHYSLPLLKDQNSKLFKDIEWMCGSVHICVCGVFLCNAERWETEEQARAFAVMYIVWGQ